MARLSQRIDPREAPHDRHRPYVYKDGRPAREAPLTPEGLTLEPNEFVWTGLYDPTDQELAVPVERFQLHPLAVEDALSARHFGLKLRTPPPAA